MAHRLWWRRHWGVESGFESGKVKEFEDLRSDGWDLQLHT